MPRNIVEVLGNLSNDSKKLNNEEKAVDNQVYFVQSIVPIFKKMNDYVFRLVAIGLVVEFGYQIYCPSYERIFTSAVIMSLIGALVAQVGAVSIGIAKGIFTTS